MSEVPLYFVQLIHTLAPLGARSAQTPPTVTASVCSTNETPSSKHRERYLYSYRGTSLIRNCPPPRTTIGPKV